MYFCVLTAMLRYEDYFTDHYYLFCITDHHYVLRITEIHYLRLIYEGDKRIRKKMADNT
jgi:hypothetical protein